MKVTPLTLPRCCNEPGRVRRRSAGFFYESWKRRAFAEHGIDLDFVQDNHSRSVRGVVRGLHYQIEHALRARDARRSVRRGRRPAAQYAEFRPRGLRGEYPTTNKHMLWIPPGFAHGFVVVSDEAEFLYKTTDFWYPEHERTLL